MASLAETVSELEELISHVNGAIKAGDMPQALRSADRARRLAPADPTVRQLYGWLLFRSGEAAMALPHLEASTLLLDTANAHAILIRALVAAGDLSAAREKLEQALSRFAIEPHDDLAAAAHELIVALSQREGGEAWAWVGLSPSYLPVAQAAGSGAALELLVKDRAGTMVGRRLLPVGDRPTQVSIPSSTPTTLNECECSLSSGSLIGKTLRHPPDFALDGRIGYEDGLATGWAMLGWRSSLMPDLMARFDKGEPFPIQYHRIDEASGHHCFRFSVEDQTFNQLSIWCRLPDGRELTLPDSPLIRMPAPEPRANRRINQEPTKSSKIDIIVPVYAGFSETIACLDSIENSSHGEADIVVINDATPDDNLAAELRTRAAQNRITLLNNRVNRGFPESVNKAAALHRDRDVVILNADAEVHGDWLQRLRATAYSATDIGTVTPLSNAGSIASYPGGIEQACTAERAVKLDTLAATVNSGAHVDLPVGVGFCLYVKRACFTETGPLDANLFGAGYGEEVDFCLRAQTRGWRHVLAGDVFVRHLGGRSFGRRKSALLARSQRLLNLRHAGYDDHIAQHLARDPAAYIRRRLAEVEFEASVRAKKTVLFVSLALPGGVRRYVNERMRAVKDQGYFVLHLRPVNMEKSRGDCRLSGMDVELDDLKYGLSDQDELIELLDRLRPEHVELHHFLGHAPRLIERIFGLKVPVDVYLHDYGFYCPQVTMVGRNGRFCGAPRLSECERCTKELGNEIQEEIGAEQLRQRSRSWLQAARKVFAPSQDARDRLASYFPNVTIHVSDLETSSVLAAKEPILPGARSAADVVRVGVIGAINKPKGYEILLECARDAAARNLPLEFIVIGYTHNDRLLSETRRCFVTGPYEEGELHGLLTRENCDLAFLPAVWPETWSYVLTEVMHFGLPVVAFDIGAIRDRLRAARWPGALLPLQLEQPKVNDAILSWARHPSFVNSASNDRSSPMIPSDQPGSQAPLASAPMASARKLLSSSEPILLPPGLYMVSVAADGAPDTSGISAVPCACVSRAPGTAANAVELLNHTRLGGEWLIYPEDRTVARIISPNASVLITTLKSDARQRLDVNVQQLSGQPIVQAPQASEMIVEEHRRPLRIQTPFMSAGVAI